MQEKIARDRFLVDAPGGGVQNDSGARLEGPRPVFTRGELELIHEMISNPQLTFPAARGRDAAGVLEKTAAAIGKA